MSLNLLAMRKGRRGRTFAARRVGEQAEGQVEERVEENVDEQIQRPVLMHWELSALHHG
jgi:hypothetical protein